MSVIVGAVTTNTVSLPVTPDGTPWPNGTLALFFGLAGPSTMTPGAGWTALQSPSANTFLAYKFLNGTETTAPYTRAAETTTDTLHISIIRGTTFQAPEATTATTDPASITPTWGGNAGTMFFVFAHAPAGTAISGVSTGFDDPKRNFEAYVNNQQIIYEQSKNGDASATVDPSTYTATAAPRIYTIAIRDSNNDGLILTQSSALFDTSHFGDPDVEAGFDYSGSFCSPLEDAPPDPSYFRFEFIDPSFDIEESDWTPDWAQAPPIDATDELPGDHLPNSSLEIWVVDEEPIVEDWTHRKPGDLGEETGETTGGRSNEDWVDEFEPLADDWTQRGATFPGEETAQTTGGRSNEDWVDEDEPVTDGHFASPLAFPDDETGETTGERSNEDWVDEDEDLTEGSYLAPLDDAAVVADGSILDTSALEVTDDDEGVTEGSYGSPLEDAPAVATVDDVGPQELGQLYDDEEPIADDWIQRGLTFPGEETGETAGESSNLDWVDEDEPVTDGHFASPLAFPDDETGQTAGGRSNEDWADDDEPVVEGWSASPLEDALVVFTDDISGTMLGEVFEDEEPLTEGWFVSPLEDAPVLNTDLTGTSFPDDTDSEGEEFHPDFFAGFSAAPLEDTPVSTAVPGLWYDLKPKRRKRRIIPIWEDDEPFAVIEAAVEAAVEIAETAPQAVSIAVDLLGPKGIAAQAPKIAPLPRSFAQIDTQAYGLILAAALQAKADASQRASDEAIRVTNARMIGAQLLADLARRLQAFHAARVKREREEELFIIRAVMEFFD